MRQEITGNPVLKIRHSKLDASLHPACFLHTERYLFAPRINTSRLHDATHAPHAANSTPAIHEAAAMPAPAPTMAARRGSTSTGSTWNRFALYSPTLQPRARVRLATSMGAAPPPHRPAPARQATPPRPVSARGTIKTTAHSQ